jgi:hypothetical protein
MNKSKYAFIVCACSKYIPEAVSLLNSLDYVGNKNDVHFYGYQIPQEIQDQFEKLDYNLIFHNIADKEVKESHGLSEVTCRKRYLFADDIGKEYEAICVLDADMVFVRDPWHYFEIAAKTGLVVGCAKEQNEAYKDPHHMFKNEWIIPEGTRPEFDLCNCPLFVDTKIWGQALRESFEIFIDGFNEMKGDNFKGADMAAMNIMLIKHGSHGKTIALSNIQWLGTNEVMLKPYLRVIEDRGNIKAECGIPVFSFHGHVGHVRWRECQLSNRHRCAQGYLKASGEGLEASDNIAKGSLRLIYERFKKMLFWKIKIEPFNYRHPEKDYKDEYGDLWE